jgi:hypothetical protein
VEDCTVITNWLSGAGPRSRVLLAATLTLASALGSGTPAAAHSPDPLLGTTAWGQDQVVPYTWATGYAPPAWLATAIDQGAADSNASRASRAAIFQRQSSAPNKIAYGGYVPCSSYGIACMNRTGVPDTFAGMWFRPHGTVLDWGTLKWCQAQTTASNGCYDARNIALDEFGHIEILGHHDNYADESDLLDAIVQFAPPVRPTEGWDYHAYLRCDVARLQLEYELLTSSTPVSTCLSLATSVVIGASSMYVQPGGTTKVTGDLEIATSTGAKRLSGDPLSTRTIKLLRREIGGTTWSVVGTMAAVSGSAGHYALTIKPASSGDYRLFFDAPSSEGLKDDYSDVISITVAVLCDPITSAKTSSMGSPMIACL